MNRDYIPAKDESFDIWQVNFLAICLANASAWGLGGLTALQGAQAIWAAAWAVARVKTTRNMGQVTAKREAREVYEALLREYIQQHIMVNPLISNSDRDNLQVKPRKTNRTAIPAPVTVPEMSTVPLVGNQVKIYFKQQPDASGVSRRGKPEGVQFCELAMSLNGMPPSPDEVVNRKLVTRSPEVAQFTAMEAGQKGYLYARWINPKGETGPWSERVEFVIP